MNGWTDRQTDTARARHADRRTGGWIDAWMDGWIDRQTDRQS